ncbi:hypothetical protein XBFFL1_1040015 [Xenorhabdus bovienii str. feltiae Florida]|nr:hypothetical protein XBFFL1_1040015 [Xenorhabdus bovienii str. feltiae Florida]
MLSFLHTTLDQNKEDGPAGAFEQKLTVLSLPKSQNRKFLFKCSRWSKT